MDFQLHRPKGYIGDGHRYLVPMAKELKRLLIAAQGSLSQKEMRLPNIRLEEMAAVLVEFAEDIHNETGIWNALEQYNIEFFATPLPLVLRPGEKAEASPVSRERLEHLLWELYSELKPELILSPAHPDLAFLALLTSRFLTDEFARVPRGSGVKAFLTRPNEFGWDVKRKLVWLGSHSYLFRQMFQDYVEKHGGKPEVAVIDDFICEKTTGWSGLGVIDILAVVLDISPEQRSELRSWYERHLAYYRVLAIKGPRIEVLNTISNKPYTIMMGEGFNPFPVGEVIAGSLVPWNKEWYWSGQQQTLGAVAEGITKESRESFLKRSPTVAYRYCPELAEKAREGVRRHRDEFLRYHGDDLATYPDGLAMSADLQKELRLQWEAKALAPEEVARVMQEHKLPGPGPAMNFPRELIDRKDGIGVYYNPDEGQDIMTGFNDILSGLKKKGVNLTQAEEDAIRSFVQASNISPRFVEKLVGQYGSASIDSAFMVPVAHRDYGLAYLLRRYKGAYYRKRYPRIALV